LTTFFITKTDGFFFTCPLIKRTRDYGKKESQPPQTMEPSGVTATFRSKLWGILQATNFI